MPLLSNAVILLVNACRCMRSYLVFRLSRFVHTNCDEGSLVASNDETRGQLAAWLPDSDETDVVVQDWPTRCHDRSCPMC